MLSDLPLSEFKIFISIVSAVILFLFSINSFSKEVHRVGGAGFKRLIAKWTKNPWMGAGLGAGVTAVVQSSTAISVITVALVNSGVFSFAQSMPVLLGANIGTTLTTQLVAWKATGMGPFFIVLGFLLSLIKSKYGAIGKSLFYFGFVFFSLEVISSAVEPLKTNTQFLELISQSSSVWLGVLMGAIFTVMVQSSSVATGVAVILVQQGILDIHQGILISLGANIGTTVTPMLSTWSMDIFAKRAAIGNGIFNVIGVLAILPVLPLFEQVLIGDGSLASGQVLANAHFWFNLGSTFIFMIFLKPYVLLLEKIVPAKTEEVIFASRFVSAKETQTADESLANLKAELIHQVNLIDQVVEWFKVAFSDLSQKSNHPDKKISYIEFLDSEMSVFASHLTKKKLSPVQANQISQFLQLSLINKEMAFLLRLFLRQWERLKGLEDSSHQNQKNGFQSYADIVEVLDQCLHQLDKLMKEPSEAQYYELKKSEDRLGVLISERHRACLLRLQSHTDEKEALLLEFLTTAQNFREKINSARKASRE